MASHAQGRCTEPYVTIPVRLLNDPRLSDQLLGTYLRIRARDWGRGPGCTATVRTIGAGKKGLSQTHEDLLELEHLGLITITRRPGRTSVIRCTDRLAGPETPSPEERRSHLSGAAEPKHAPEQADPENHMAPVARVSFPESVKTWLVTHQLELVARKLLKQHEPERITLAIQALAKYETVSAGLFVSAVREGYQPATEKQKPDYSRFAPPTTARFARHRRDGAVYPIEEIRSDAVACRNTLIPAAEWSTYEWLDEASEYAGTGTQLSLSLIHI